MKIMVSLLMMMSVVGISVIHAYPAEPLINFHAARITRETHTSKKPIDPNHVPSSACKNMLPIHGNNTASNDPAPFEITVSANKAANGDRITVTVKGKGSEVYKGLYIQGRINDEPVGQFLPSKNPLIRLSDCPPGERNAASYISNIQAVNEVSLDWIAPKAAGSEVVFKATIVKTFAEFWVGLLSEKIKLTA